MDNSGTSKIKVLVIAILLILTLPLFYLLVARVLLPLEWHETPVSSSTEVPT